MPKASIGSSQRRTIQRIETAIGVRSSYIESDDSYQLRDDRVFAYIKVLSPAARSGPRSGLKVIVKKSSWTIRFPELVVGNDWFGSESQHLFVPDGDDSASARAIEVLKIAKSIDGDMRR